MGMVDAISQLATRIANLERKLSDNAPPRLTMMTLDNGYIKERDANGNLVGRIGKQGDGTHAYVVLDGPVPAKPKTPTAAAYPGCVRVGWDGKTAQGNPMPSDFAACEVYSSSTSSPTSYYLEGTIASPAGGVITCPAAPGVNRNYVLRIRTTANKVGAYSDVKQVAAGAYPGVTTAPATPPTLTTSQVGATVKNSMLRLECVYGAYTGTLHGDTSDPVYTSFTDGTAYMVIAWGWTGNLGGKGDVKNYVPFCYLMGPRDTKVIPQDIYLDNGYYDTNHVYAALVNTAGVRGPWTQITPVVQS